MWNHDDDEPSAAVREPAAESSFSSPSSRFSCSERSREEPSPRSGFGPASDSRATIGLGTAERLYRVLGTARAARPGEVLQRPDLVSTATLRRWKHRGWIGGRERLFLTRRGCEALPSRSRVVAFAAASGRSTLFL